MSLRLPKQLKIGGITYKIELIDGLADCGSTDFNRQIILINKGQTEDRQLSALYHEVIEVFNEMGDLDLKHQTIQTLESFAFQVIKDNR